MNLTHPVTVLIPCPFPMPRCVAHRGVAATEAREAIVTAPFIRIDHRTWLRHPDHEALQGLLIRMLHDLESRLPRSPARAPYHGGTVAFHRPMTLDFVGA